MGVKRKYTPEILQEAANKSDSYSDMVRIFNLKTGGGSAYYMSQLCEKFGIDVSHFTRRKAYNASNLLKIENNKPTIFEKVKNYRVSGSKLAKALIKIGRVYQCEGCYIGGLYNGEQITLEVDHVDGDCFNNVESNLRFLCPNCHSQTKTYRSKNRK